MVGPELDKDMAALHDAVEALKTPPAVVPEKETPAVVEFTPVVAAEIIHDAQKEVETRK